MILRHTLIMEASYGLLVGKPTGDIRNNASYAADFAPGSFIYDYLKVSHVSLSA